MKKISLTLATAGMFILGSASASAAVLQEEAAASKGFTQVLKEQFIQGGPAFMGIVLLCLILGLAVAIERIIYLNMATTNTSALKESVEAALASGGVEEAKNVCRETAGPVASIYYQGLERSGEGLEAAEKAVVSAFGGVGTALLVTTVILVAGFAILAQSSFGLNSAMASLTAISLFMALIADLTILPSLLILLDRKMSKQEPQSDIVAA